MGRAPWLNTVLTEDIVLVLSERMRGFERSTGGVALVTLLLLLLLLPVGLLLLLYCCLC